jgi:hypothetical protein
MTTATGRKCQSPELALERRGKDTEADRGEVDVRRPQQQHHRGPRERILPEPSHRDDERRRQIELFFNANAPEMISSSLERHLR